MSSPSTAAVRSRPATALAAVVVLVAGLLAVLQTAVAPSAAAATFPTTGEVSVPVPTARPTSFSDAAYAATCDDGAGGSVQPLRSITLLRASGDLPEFPVVDVAWHCGYPAGAPVSPTPVPVDRDLVQADTGGVPLATRACPAATPVFVGLDVRFTTGTTVAEGYTGDAVDDVRPVCGALGTDGRAYGAVGGDWVSGTDGWDAVDTLRCAPGAFVTGLRGHSDAGSASPPQLYALGVVCDAPVFDPAVVAATFPQTAPEAVDQPVGTPDAGDPTAAACGRGVVATGFRLAVEGVEGGAAQLGTLGVTCSPLTSPTTPTSLVDGADVPVLVPPGDDGDEVSACPAGTVLTGVRGTDAEVGSGVVLGALSGYCSTLDVDGTTSTDGEPDVSPEIGITGGAFAGVASCPAGRVVTGFTVSEADEGYGPTPVGLLLSCSPVTLGVPVQPANSSWTTATLLQPDDTVTQALTSPGGALWFKVPVQPSSTVSATLSDLPVDDDLSVFSDIGQAFLALSDTQDLTRLSAEFAGVDVAPTTFSPTTFSPTTFSPTTFSPTTFSPTTFSPTTFSPTTFSPTTFSPTTFSPTTFSPTTFSPTTFSPTVTPDQYLAAGAFPDVAALAGAFSAAQTRSLLAVSARAGLAPESFTGSTYTRSGYYYLRVTARDGATAPEPVTLAVTTTGGPCDVPLDTFAGVPTLPAAADGAGTVVLTDTGRFGSSPTAALTDANSRLTAAAAGGGPLAGIGPVAVLDLAGSPRVQQLQAQADAHPGCPYAENLVAQGIRDIVNGYRGPSHVLRYVVVEGDDAVVPFFRYADTAGVAPESGFVPPVADGTASDASLRGDFVLGQDAYGAADDLTLGGLPVPVPDVAVGRVVESPAEIAATLDAYVDGGGAAIDPTSTLATGYDFLAAGAQQIASSFAAADADGRNDTLITDQGVDRTLTTVGGQPSPDRTWTADDLRTELLGSRHDVVYLAGHFSANAALAADFSSVVTARELATAPAGNFRGTLVFSAGCHSGYNLVDGHAVAGVTDPLDWAQAFAQQGATIVAGTGYQYGDTDFVKYSNQLYVDFAAALRRGEGAVAVGTALVQAKRDYLAGQATIDGLDQKSLLEATVFGLPMQGVDFATGRTPAASPSTSVTATKVTSQPGATFGLQRTNVTVTPQLTPHAVTLSRPGGGSVDAGYLSGPGGVEVTPAAPALPVVPVDVTAPAGTVLRGVGFRSGTYTDTLGVTPLTGAPATETNTVHGPFVSDVFYPTRLGTPNYFDALAGGSSTGSTRLFVTPAQYRSDASGSLTDRQRQYGRLGFTAYYSGDTATYGTNQPAAAAAPALTATTATAEGRRVTFSTHATGDPAAGIAQVWATWTLPPAAGGQGSWRSVDLRQDARDSTRWTGTVMLPAGSKANSLRFLVQAVNGVGVVGIDDALGAYHRLATPADVVAPAALTLRPGLPAAVTAGTTLSAAATLTDAGGAPLADRAVVFGAGGSSRIGVTNRAGVAQVALPLTAAPGPVDVTAGWAGDAVAGPATSASVPVTVTRRPTALGLTATAAGFTVVLRDTTGPGRPIGIATRTAFLVATDGSGTVLAVRPVTLDAAGRAIVPASAVPVGTRRVTAWFGSAVIPTTSGTLDQTDPLYLPAAPVTVDLRPDRLTLAPSTSTTMAGSAVTYTATAVTAGVSTPVSDRARFTIVRANGRPATGATCAGASCSATAAGNYVVTATYLGRTATAALTVAPAGTSAVTLAPATATVAAGVTRPYTVTATDRYGNVLPAAPADLQITPATGGSTVGAACTATGCAAASVGSYRVTATRDGVSGTATLTVVAGPPASVFATAGDGQSATVGTDFRTALAAVVVDAAGNPVAGADVTFVLAPPDPTTGTASFAGGVTTVTVVSDAAGSAVAPALTAGDRAGPVTVSATVPGVSTPASYDLAVTTPPPASADLGVTIAMTPDDAGAITATITVHNAGPDTAAATVVKLGITGAAVVQDAGGGQRRNDRLVRFRPRGLTAGATVTFIVVLTRTRTDRAVLGVATALSSTADPQSADNIASALVPAG